MIRKLILAAALAIGAVAASAAPSVSLNPSAATAEVGSSFTVDIDIAGVTNLYAWQIDFEFDPFGLADATTQTEGSFLGAGTSFVTGTIDNLAGTLSGIGSSLSGITGVDGGGTLATIGFDALATGTVTFKLLSVLLLDSNLDTIFISNVDDWFDGRIEIVPAVTPVPLPSTLALLVLGLGLAVGRGLRTAKA